MASAFPLADPSISGHHAHHPRRGDQSATRILDKLSDKGYAGPLSVELFLPKFRDGDPFEVAREIRAKAEAVMQGAGVM